MPVRSLDQVVRDTLGNQGWTIVTLVAENEALKEQVQQLTAKLAQYEPPDASPDPS